MVPILVRSNGPPRPDHDTGHPDCIGQKFGKRLLSPNKPKQASKQSTIHHPHQTPNPAPSPRIPATHNPSYQTAQSARSPLNAIQPTNQEQKPTPQTANRYKPSTYSSIPRPSRRLEDPTIYQEAHFQSSNIGSTPTHWIIAEC